VLEIQYLNTGGLNEEPIQMSLYPISILILASPRGHHANKKQNVEVIQLGSGRDLSIATQCEKSVY
jgi:hypothetical protein